MPGLRDHMCQQQPCEDISSSGAAVGPEQVRITLGQSITVVKDTLRIPQTYLPSLATSCENMASQGEQPTEMPHCDNNVDDTTGFPAWKINKYIK